jgi:CheY-like chemotaxis protein
MNVAKILVVEDEPTICKMCALTLTGEGFGVDIAANGKIAGTMLVSREYDLILVDIKMPDMDGKQLYQMIVKEYPQLINGVIFTSGDVLSGDTERFIKKSGRLFLPKPFTIVELKSVITEGLHRFAI